VSFATLLGRLSDDEMIRLQSLARSARWREVPTREYLTAEVTDFWEPCERAFFILVPPRTEIHRHNDEAIKGVTHHLVLQTNPKSLNWWLEDGREHSVHLKAGHRYIVQREPVHWARNDGVTDRSHLLVEYPHGRS
jgi:hypothetical protein